MLLMAYNLHRNIEKNHNRYQSDSKRPLQFSGELSQINVLLGWAQANVGRYQTNHTNYKFGKQEQGLTENVTWDTSPDTCLGSQKPVGPPGKARCHVDEVQEQSVFFKITPKNPARHHHLTSPLSLPKTGANRNGTTWNARKWKVNGNDAGATTGCLEMSRNGSSSKKRVMKNHILNIFHNCTHTPS